MIYYTVYNGLIDSISEDYSALRLKFPNETIFSSDKPINTVYINERKSQKGCTSN